MEWKTCYSRWENIINKSRSHCLLVELSLSPFVFIHMPTLPHLISGKPFDVYQHGCQDGYVCILLNRPSISQGVLVKQPHYRYGEYSSSNNNSMFLRDALINKKISKIHLAFLVNTTNMISFVH